MNGRGAISCFGITLTNLYRGFITPGIILLLSDTINGVKFHMIIIGELLNSTRKQIRQAIEKRDADTIRGIALAQAVAGADYLDVNAGALADQELEALEWMIGIVRESTDKPLCIDSPRPEALALGCRLAGDGPILINSISAEKARYEEVLPLIVKHRAGVVALAMDDEGLLEDDERMFSVASHLVEDLAAAGVEHDRIFLDPLVRPVATGSHYGNLALDLIGRIRGTFPGIHLSCGLSNVSFGLPERRLVNRAFLMLCMARGLNAAIMDPTDQMLMGEMRAAEALLGRDEYCMNYIAASRSGNLGL